MASNQVEKPRKFAGMTSYSIFFPNAECRADHLRYHQCSALASISRASDKAAEVTEIISIEA